MIGMGQVLLGLIGNSIDKSSAPFLHKMLGEVTHLNVDYRLNDPGDSDQIAFEKTLNQLRSTGYCGANITFPFKQLALNYADIVDVSARSVGATNTLVFKDSKIFAFNTDYTGFISAYRSKRNDEPAGTVLMLGAGGVGRAVAFGLFQLGATELIVFDLNPHRAAGLVSSLRDSGFNARSINSSDLPQEALNVEGIINCTPVGHYATPGLPIVPALIDSQRWAFDAVYVPIDTQFLKLAHSKGLALISGFDLFFNQGIDAFEAFTGIKVNSDIALSKYFSEFRVETDLFPWSTQESK